MTPKLLLQYALKHFKTKGNDLGGVVLGLAWTLNSVSGFTVATAVVRRFGFKNSMIISFWGYTFQIASLYLAAVIPDLTTSWTIAIVG